MNLRRRFLSASGALALLGAARTALAQIAPRTSRVALIDTAELTANMTEDRNPYWGTLISELRQLGYIEGRTVSLERWTGAGAGAYEELARSVVASGPHVIVARARVITVAVASATKTIPIVAVGTIPTELRESLARPGKNVTGFHVSLDQQLLYIKLVEFMRELAGQKARIAWLGPQFAWDSEAGAAAREGARQTKLTLIPVIVATPIDERAIRQAFAAIAGGGFGGVLMSPATEFYPLRATIAEHAAAARLPSVASGRFYAEAGLTLSYASDAAVLWRRAAHYVDKILKGAKPGDLPIEQASRFELVVNMKTAKALGLAIPPSILLRADRVIE